MGRVFASSPGDQGSIRGRIIPKTLKKWYLIPPCLTLSNITYVSRVKWSNPGKGVAPSPTPQCSSYWKGSLLIPSTTVANFTFLISSGSHRISSDNKSHKWSRTLLSTIIIWISIFTQPLRSGSIWHIYIYIYIYIYICMYIQPQLTE